MRLRLLQSACPIPRHDLHGAGPGRLPYGLDRPHDLDDPDGRRGLDRLSDLGGLHCLRAVQALSRSIT